jgi:hypothetical protein
MTYQLRETLLSPASALSIIKVILRTYSAGRSRPDVGSYMSAPRLSFLGRESWYKGPTWTPRSYYFSYSIPQVLTPKVVSEDGHVRLLPRRCFCGCEQLSISRLRSHTLPALSRLVLYKVTCKYVHVATIKSRTLENSSTAGPRYLVRIEIINRIVER